MLKAYSKQTMNQKYASTSLIEFELNGEAGIYFIQLLSADSTKTFKINKK